MNQLHTTRVGFFGGSFDPPHRGHLAVARAAQAALGLGRVLLAPVGAQPLKPGGASASFAQRAEMVRLAIAGETGFELSLADAPAADGRPNFTYQTLEKLRAELGASAQLYCLMGADSLRMLRQWREAGRIPLLAELVVAARPGQPLNDLAELLPVGLTLAHSEPARAVVNGVTLESWTLRSTSGESSQLHVLPGVDEDVSATGLRSSGAADETWLPAPVAEYIRQNGLYR